MSTKLLLPTPPLPDVTAMTRVMSVVPLALSLQYTCKAQQGKKGPLSRAGRKEREVYLQKVQATNAEEFAFKVFADMKLDMDTNKTNYSGILFKTSLEKSLFSSPAACIKSIDERHKKLRKNRLFSHVML